MDFDHPVIARFEDFARRNDLVVCGIEFIETADGRILTYDTNTNTNTNYNAAVEAVAPKSAPRELVRYLATLG